MALKARVEARLLQVLSKNKKPASVSSCFLRKQAPQKTQDSSGNDNDDNGDCNTEHDPSATKKHKDDMVQYRRDSLYIVGAAAKRLQVATTITSCMRSQHRHHAVPFRPLLRLLLVVTLLSTLTHIAHAMVLRRPWTTQQWCKSVEQPQWPFAYQKSGSQTLEWKGRVNSNRQDVRHQCAVFGVQSKCHRCEDIACGGGSGASSTCAYQLQGIAWSQLPKNIPTVTDVPWAVGGRHRYDYGGSSRMCLFLSGDACISPFQSDYSACVVRCWGSNSGVIQVGAHPERGNASRLPQGDAEAADIWSYPTTYSGDGKPQGLVSTLAGSGEKGFLDGPTLAAKFNNPQDVAADSRGFVYVADTDNHRIRRIDPTTQTVTTIAGDGTQGCTDGAATNGARFSFPMGVAVFEDAANSGQVTVFVADTGNHRIRKIVNGVVYCVAGLCGNGVESAILTRSPARPHAGLADGDSLSSRYDTPMGIAVDVNGVVFVADTGNHLIRRIERDGTTNTLAGNVAPSEVAVPGCVPPYLRGVAGFRDGNLTYARFNSPRDVTIGPQSTMVVADGHRIRRVNYDGTTSNLETIASANRVVTLAGSQIPGNVDGSGDEATFNSPAGVTVSADGRVFVVSPVTCKLRQVSTASLVARPVSCLTTASEVLLPSGCSSYEPPVDELFIKVSPAADNIYYNYRTRATTDPIDGLTLPGRKIKDCTGTPPVDELETGDKSLPILDSANNAVTAIKEDAEDGTTIKISCPALCVAQQTLATSSRGKVYGTKFYSDASAICLAAVHSGVLQDAAGGLVVLTLERGVGFYDDAIRLGSTANGVVSVDLPNVHAAARLFSIKSYPKPTIEVQTVAGAPSALLRSGCGFQDGMPPLAARFNGPSGIEVFYQNSLSRTQLVFIADSKNHRIRQMTATCTKICENGGTCVAPDTCSCRNGWTGDDCSIPTCANGGTCSAPDTCSCGSGWFDSNCTTPVCSQTCGNGGNCTSPDTCSCPLEWQGADCRVPVCSQVCQNGGSCVAPSTCLCAAGWSGHDCSLPICSQGFFVAHPSGYANALWRPFAFENYAPCDWGSWCDATNEFDCLYRAPVSPLVNVSFGASGRFKTGRVLDPSVDPLNALATSKHYGCMLVEVGKTALTHYQYLSELNSSSGFYRFSPLAPYGWNATKAPWRGIATAGVGFSPPFATASDRQVTLVEKRSVVQGVYACANGGSCVSPGVCKCANGWIGFDCRTPVCTQGYYTPSQPTFVAADPPESVHPRQPTSNPTYTALVETIAYDALTTTNETRGGVRYLPTQGGYACSIRSLTAWEKPATIGPNASAARYYDHPNYVSLYMDKTLSADGYYHTQWLDMFWPPLYNLTTPLLDNTREGWKRGGKWYYLTGRQWQKGKCLVEFSRTCPASSSVLPVDLVTGLSGVLVVDTDASYRPQVVYSIARAARKGFWNASLFGGECVDQVVRGCFNNGTCVAPDTCQCASGWSGSDCTIPICEQQCLHNGNCTLSNRCTCETGWTGADCSVPMCAQDCRNGGTCVAPDTCACKTWVSTWRDGRENGGQPVFRKPNGLPQDTGYTGYDCNTPICVQAERFILNTDRSASGFLSLRGHGKNGKLACSTYRCPQYDEELISNDGHSFQSGCSVGNPLANPIGVLTDERKLANLRAYKDVFNTDRMSDSYLCGNLAWQQGDYTLGRYTRVNYVNVTKVSDERWVLGTVTAGEGVFMCFNKGSCIAPDTCSCGDGWQGIDCNVPLCRFLQTNGSVSTGCMNDGVCVDKDTCKCVQIESTLHETYPAAPRGLTGFFGSDCALPVCIQGVFDPLCQEPNSAGVDGCFRCKNGGKCVAPDVCECADGWSGFDCGTPICQVTSVTSTLREQLFTVDDQKVLAFQADPCGTNGGRWGKEVINGALIGQGNCTLPALCTCLCRQKYDKQLCANTGEFCEKPWKDPFHRSIPPGFVYGTRDCVDGFQGIEDEKGRFQSCHLQIYVPSTFRRYTVSIVAILSVLSAFFLIGWSVLRQRLRRRMLLAKAERRRSRKNSEENPTKAKSGAFAHAKKD
ncbi:hypothetical protein Gpo141_00007014 [Globisporangium polare]